MIVYSKRNLRIAELLFAESGELPERTDVVRFQFRTEKVSKQSTPIHTRLIDLGGTPDQLLAGMNATTRRHIRQAEREGGCTFELNESPGVPWMEEFLSFFGRFAAEKGLPPANRERVAGMRDCGALVLSRTVDTGGSTLVWHAYARTGAWARLLHSASLFRQADKDTAARIARTNRWHHWRDMIRLGEAGVACYDLGGWYLGDADADKLRINQFKEGFGGRVAPLFNTDRGVSWKGIIALQARRVMKGLGNG